jgi:hypothetical protein
MRTRALVTTISVNAAMALLATTIAATGGTAQPSPLRLEVAENGTRYVFDRQQHVDEEDIALRGNTFLAEGYLYPEGTLTCQDGICNGVVIDEGGVGAAEVPDAVIGTWTCYGMHVEDAGTVRTGPITATTQIFDLGQPAGAEMLVTTLDR